MYTPLWGALNCSLFYIAVSPNKEFGDFAAFDNNGSSVAKPTGYELKKLCKCRIVHSILLHQWILFFVLDYWTIYLNDPSCYSKLLNHCSFLTCTCICGIWATIQQYFCGCLLYFKSPVLDCLTLSVCFLCDSRSDSFADFSQFNPAAASSSSSETASNDLLDVFGNTPASVSSSGNMGIPAMGNINMSGMNQPMMGVNMNMGMSGVPNQVSFIISIQVIKCLSIFASLHMYLFCLLKMRFHTFFLLTPPVDSLFNSR